ncbi:MAG: hypothetical protein K1X29_08130 [Bdellovibrionales bacterium]|nr:hypothetical protein [Bdellovibrionales bacterium]
MTYANVLESGRFHFRHAWFNLREQFSDIPTALAANALIPFFVWILSNVWQRFNSHQGNFTFEQVIVYIGITELLFMTFVRAPSVSRASGDFSISLARPRSWLVISFSGLVGRSIGGRIFMLCLLICVFPILGTDLAEISKAVLRLLILLPWLGIIQGLFALFFSVAQVLWHQTNYFLLPFGKIFLVLGGVWGPIADFSEPWRKWLLILPPSDIFFQPAYFCVKGNFYGISVFEWFLRTSFLILVLTVINIYFFKMAKTRHQSYGG